MNSDLIKEYLDKIPIGLITAGFFMYLGYQYYVFNTDPSSPLVVQKKVYDTAKENNVKLDNKLKETREFVKTLELKKVELRQLAQDLKNIKGTLSEKLDIPNFMKMIVTEAKKVGLEVRSLKPLGSTDHEEYTEQLFTMDFGGIFVQFLAFLDRLSNVTEIVRVDEFRMGVSGSSRARFVQLTGNVMIKAFRYRGSKADSIGKPENDSNSVLLGTPTEKVGDKK